MENRLNKMLKLYEEVKQNSFIIGTINPDFFFEICDCLIDRIKELENSGVKNK
jgi:hypothetical protein